MGSAVISQKSTHLELMLGQIANYCPIISRNTIVKNSTSVNQIWQDIRLHFGFQSSGSHFLDFNNIHLEPGERPEDLYQRLNSFVEDNLLKSNGSIRHHGEIPENDEDMCPTLENFVVLTWLRLAHPDLPALVKQRYGTELRSQTLSSIKPEISQAPDSLLEEIHAPNESKVLRSAIKFSSANIHKSDSKQLIKRCVSCPLCKQAGRPFQHFLSKCKYLPESDKAYLSKTRLTTEITDIQDYNSDSIDYVLPLDSVSVDEFPIHSLRVVSIMRRISTEQSPQMKVFYKHFPLQLILDSGAEISMIKTSVANYISAPIQKTIQKVLQADGVTPLSIAGETHIVLSRNNVILSLKH